MATLILAVAGLSVVAASLLAAGAPNVLLANYQRWSRISSYVALAGIAWVAIGAGVAVNMINRILQTKAISTESALSDVQVLVSSAVDRQRAIPALLALLIAAGYVEVLGRNRARAARGNAA